MKKAIELSMNFLVTIIIALVIFGFGVRFIYNLASQSEKLKDLTLEDLDKKIEDLFCESTDKICIGTNKKIIERGNYDFFTVKVINILNDQEFRLNIEKPTPSGYTKNNEPINTNDIKLKYRENFFIKRNEEKSIAIGIEVPKNAISGTYILDVKIEPYYLKDKTTLQKIYVAVP